MKIYKCFSDINSTIKSKMNKSNEKFKDVDEYIAGLPSEVQVILKKIRATIKKPHRKQMNA